jgi:hypothetical protein
MPGIDDILKEYTLILILSVANMILSTFNGTSGSTTVKLLLLIINLNHLA